MKNEKGAVLPSVLLFSLLLFAFLLHEIEMTSVEKRFYFEAEQALLLDQLMMNSVQEAKRVLAAADAVPGGITYTEAEGAGAITYTAVSPTIMEVAISCSTKQGRAYKASFLYNREEQRLIKWTERR